MGSFALLYIFISVNTIAFGYIGYFLSTYEIEI